MKTFTEYLTENDIEDARDKRRLKSFHKCFMGEVAERARQMADEVAKAGHKYEVGDVVRTSKNIPYKIIGKNMLHDSRGLSREDVWKPRLLKQQPRIPAYRVESPDASFDIPEHVILGKYGIQR